MLKDRHPLKYKKEKIRVFSRHMDIISHREFTQSIQLQDVFDMAEMKPFHRAHCEGL